VARNDDYWATHIARSVSRDSGQPRPRGELFVAEKPSAPRKLLGYAVVHWWHLHPETTCYFEMTELCTLPTEDGVEAALLAEISKRAGLQDCNMSWARLFLPREPRIERAIGHALRDPRWSTFVELRAKRIVDQADERSFAITEAMCWSADVL
jgi:hypothetical protein